MPQFGGVPGGPGGPTNQQAAAMFYAAQAAFLQGNGGPPGMLPPFRGPPPGMQFMAMGGPGMHPAMGGPMGMSPPHGGMGVPPPGGQRMGPPGLQPGVPGQPPGPMGPGGPPGAAPPKANWEKPKSRALKIFNPECVGFAHMHPPIHTKLTPHCLTALTKR
jgi:hypothetical protein